jgi:hypothetical protein
MLYLVVRPAFAGLEAVSATRFGRTFPLYHLSYGPEDPAGLEPATWSVTGYVVLPAFAELVRGGRGDKVRRDIPQALPLSYGAKPGRTRTGVPEITM